MILKKQRALGIACSAGLALPAAAQDVIVTEVFYNPSGREAETEWVELFNRGTQPVDISGWMLGDEDNNSPSDPFGSGQLLNLDGTVSPESDDGSIVNSLVIQPGEAIVIGGFWDPRTEGDDGVDNTMDAFVRSWGEDTDGDGVGDTTSFRVVLLVNTITIANTASLTNEVLRLDDDSGMTVDDANYQVGRDENDWPFSSNGRSIYLQPNFLNGTDNDVGTAWALSAAGRDGGREGRLVEVDQDNDGSFDTLYGEADVASPGFVETSLGASFEDANGNGRDDALDIFLGTSSDCDRNRVPDEAQPDCNGNGIPDVCDGFATQIDCDRDGLPDSCQIAGDPSLDANMNGVLDACEDVFGKVIITEIMFNPSGSEREWIELYNASSETIDVTNYFFQDFDQPVPDGPEPLFGTNNDVDGDTVPDPILLGPGQILVVGDEPLDSWEAAWGSVSAAGYRYVQAPLSLANNADLVNENRTLLRADVDGDGNILSAIVSDNANYSGTTSNAVPQNGWPGDDGRGSFYVLGTGNPADVTGSYNDDGGNWNLSIDGLDGAYRVNATDRFDGRDVGSPGFINFGVPQRAAGEVVITELMYAGNSDFPGQPGFDAPDGLDEWIEIYNTTGQTIDVSGWYIEDEDGRTTGFPAGSVLAPGEVAVVAGNDDYETNPLPLNEFYAAWGCGYQVFVVADWYEDSTGPGLDRLSDTAEGGTATNPSAAREIITIREPDGTLQDVVNYDDDGFVWPLVNTNGQPTNDAWSVYLFNQNDYNEIDNDSGLNYAASLIGLDGGREPTPTAVFNGMQFGSPGHLDGVQVPDLGDCPPLPCSRADLARGFGALDFFDVSTFLGLFDDGHPAADINNDGAFDFFDISGFLALFGAGC